MPWAVMDQAVGLLDGIFFVANHLRWTFIFYSLNRSCFGRDFNSQNIAFLSTEESYLFSGNNAT
jgi:hypothetical protein